MDGSLSRGSSPRRQQGVICLQGLWKGEEGSRGRVKLIQRNCGRLTQGG